MTLIEATRALQAGDMLKAEQLGRAALATDSNHPEALRLLAHVASATGRTSDAEPLLRHAIASAPADVRAYVDLASLLCKLERRDEALALMKEAIARYPHEIWPLSVKAAILSAERLAEPAVEAHAAVVARAPGASVPWMNYAHALKTVGRTDEAITAYRKALSIDPGYGAAWWGLANLRTVRLDAEDITYMTRVLPGVRDPLQKVQLTFALGKGLGDIGQYAGSFQCYKEANRLRGTLVPYDPASTRHFVQACETMFTPDVFAGRAEQGCDAEGAIFIIGMPRAGSTLVEQILASHPLVEGLGELFELRNIAASILGTNAKDTVLPEAIIGLSADELRALGESYLRSIRRHRRTDRPFFTDKLPSNWRLIPLIRLILPNARIIDVRRSPRACCLSIFATYFNRETSVPATLTDLAQYYRDYTRLMAHLDTILPGHIHRVHHEKMVTDLATEVHSLLDFLELPFDPACLRFHETQRPIHTPSAQQVRRPIDRDSLDHWRNYERWLDPVEQVLNTRSEPCG